MFVDLYHNYIVKNTITEGFEESVEKKLMPKLEAKYGAALLGIQMYEDYIADAFYARGEWYYPLTVILPEGPITQWIKWRMKAGSFKDGLPYAYIGEGLLDINILDEVPSEFAEKLENRATFSTSPAIKINIETPAKDPTFLSGRYSQSFVDEMARQLTLRISEAMSVSGIDAGPVTLSLVFAPATYMEHTSENVTYRRLLITDGVSAPRDFWVKWTREDGAMAYSVSDHVSAECISFEIGEDVPQKVREKEYRFLLAAGGDKYHNAMGRKNITEWREIIKRAIRKGELTKIEEPESNAGNDDINAALAAVLGKNPVNETAAEPKPATESDEFARAMAMAREIMAERESEADEDSFVPEIPAEEEIGETEAVEIQLEPMAEKAAETEISFAPVTEEPAEAPSIFDLHSESFEEIDDEEALEAEGEIEEDASDDIADLAALDGVETAEAAEIAEEAPASATEPMPTREEIEAKIRAEVEAKIRAEYEARIKAESEAEAARLREEKEALRRQHEELVAKAEAEKIRLAKLEEARLAEEDKMRRALDEQLRREAAERQRMAEAAKIALDEARREEEARRLAAEKAAEEKAAAERAAAAKKAAEERKIQAKTNEAIAGGIRTKNYTYTSKTVKLLFRRSVDPNITSRIYEIIKTTLEYYGKEKMYMRIKATIPDTTTVNLEFLEIPMEEMALLSNIIKVLGNSGLGIAKAIVD